MAYDDIKYLSMCSFAFVFYFQTFVETTFCGAVHMCFLASLYFFYESTMKTSLGEPSLLNSWTPNFQWS